MYDITYKAEQKIQGSIMHNFGAMVEQKCKTCAHKAILVHHSTKIIYYYIKFCVCDIFCSSHIICEK